MTEAELVALALLEDYVIVLDAVGLPSDAALIAAVANDLRAELLGQGEAHAVPPREKHASAPVASPPDSTFAISGYPLQWASVAQGARGPTRFSRLAFGKSLLRVPLLNQHRDDQPLGYVTVTPDSVGLNVAGRVASTTLGRDVVAVMQTGGLSGLSVGFDAIRSHAEPKTGVRIVDEARLHEISVCTFPADKAARIAAVDGQAIPTLHAAAPFERATGALARRLVQGDALLRAATRYLVGEDEEDDADELPVMRDLAGRRIDSRLAREGARAFELTERLRLRSLTPPGMSHREFETLRLQAYGRARGWLA